MRLKAITIAFLVLMVLLLLASPLVIRGMPTRAAPRQVRRAYAERTLDYLGVFLLAFVGSGVCSFLVYRKARQEYQEESLRNLKSLLETPVKSGGKADQETSGEPDAAS